MVTTNVPGVVVSRRSDVALWVLQVLAVLVYLGSAAGKLFADPAAVASFAAMGVDRTGMSVIAVVEILGAIGLLVPRLVGLAALALVALMVGAVTMTLAAFGPALVAVPTTVLVLVTVIAWGRRATVPALVHRFTS